MHAAQKRAQLMDLEPRLPRDLVMRFLDYPPGRQPPASIDRVLAEVLVEARSLVRARGAWLQLPVSHAPELGLEDPGASGLVLGLVTAGSTLERRCASLQQQDDITRALLMDAAGSAAAEEAADLLCLAVAANTDLATSCRISPGYGSWPLTAQQVLFEHLPADRLGVSLGPSSLMFPLKSISFAAWLGATGRPAAGATGCAHCPLARCRYRRSPAPHPS